MKFILVSGIGVMLLILGFAAPVQAATFIVQPGTDPVLFKETLDKLRVAIMKLRALGVTVPISALATAGYDYQESTDFTLDMGQGAEGPEVVALQTYLIKEGHSIPSGVTGIFNAETTTALAAYQKKHDITPAAGYFGEKTRAYIKKQGGQ